MLSADVVERATLVQDLGAPVQPSDVKLFHVGGGRLQHSGSACLDASAIDLDTKPVKIAILNLFILFSTCCRFRVVLVCFLVNIPVYC